MSKIRKDIVIFGDRTWWGTEEFKKGRPGYIIDMIRKYNFASKLVYIEAPMDRKSIFLSPRFKYLEHKRCIFQERYIVEDNICIVRYFRITRPIFLAKILDWLNAKMIERAIHILKLENPILWSFSPLSSDCFNLSIFKNKIFDAIDNWMPLIRNDSEEYRKLVLNGYKNICSKADCVFTTSEKTSGFLNSMGYKKAVCVPNGVDASLLEDEVLCVPEDVRGLKRPIMGYVGSCFNMRWMRADLNLIKYVAERNPEVTLAFVGPIENKEYLDSYFPSNVHLLGIKPKNKIKQYLYSFDIAMVPHLVNELTEGMDPLKIYEYLAVGLPIISTSVQGVGKFKELIYIANTPEEFSLYINEVLKENPALRERRRQVAKEYTWDNIFKNMHKIIIRARNES